MGASEPLETSYRLAVQSIDSGRIIKGLHFLLRVLRHDPNHVPALLLRGEILYRTRKYRLARRDFLKVLGLAPGNERASVYMGLICGVYGRDEEGREYYRQALQALPNDLSVLWLYADSCFRIGNYQLAISNFQTILDLMPGDVDAMTDIAYCHYHMGSYGEAITSFRRVLRSAPAHVEALVDAGRISMLMGLRDQARFFLARALKIDGAALEALVSLGFLHYYMGDRESAEAKVARCLELDGRHPEALLLLGCLQRGSEGPAPSPVPTLEDFLPLCSSSTRPRRPLRRIVLPLSPPAGYGR